jgi:hypothetical protein
MTVGRVADAGLHSRSPANLVGASVPLSAIEVACTVVSFAVATMACESAQAAEASPIIKSLD